MTTVDQGSTSHLASPIVQSLPMQNAVQAVQRADVLTLHNNDHSRALDAVLAERNALAGQNAQLWRLVEKLKVSVAQQTREAERLRDERNRASNGWKKSASSLSDFTIPAHITPTDASMMDIQLGSTDSEDLQTSIQNQNPVQINKPFSRNDYDSSADATAAAFTPAKIPLAQTRHTNYDVGSPPRAPEFGSLTASDDARRSANEDQLGYLPIRAENTTPSSKKRSSMQGISMLDFPAETRSYFANLPASPTKTSEMPSIQLVSSKEPSQTARKQMTPEASRDGSPNRPLPAAVPPRYSSVHSPQQNLAIGQVRSSASAASSEASLLTGNSPSFAKFNQSATSLDGGISIRDVLAASPPIELSPQIRSSRQAPPVLTARHLPYTTIQVATSRITTNAKEKEVILFAVNVTVNQPDSPPDAWKVEKLYSQILELDHDLRTLLKDKRSHGKLKDLPNAKMFKEHSPANIHARKEKVEAFLCHIVSPTLVLRDWSVMCNFLTTNVVDEAAADLKKAKFGRDYREGYLIKRGPKATDWKARFFVIQSPLLHMYESQGGTHLGTVIISGSAVGVQRQVDNPKDTNVTLRHAFSIQERIDINGRPLIADKYTTHYFCADNDEERDDWINTVIRWRSEELPAVFDPSEGGFVELYAEETLSPLASSFSARRKSVSQHGSSASIHKGHARTQSVERATDAFAHALLEERLSPEIPSSTGPYSSPAHKRPPPSRALTNEASNVSTTPQGDKTKPKSGRFWQFGNAAAAIKDIKPIFGVPLAESLAVSGIANIPAVVYRCIEYLEGTHAESEEGIYRLSGSSTTVKTLRERFEAEGDVNLLGSGERYDSNAVAGLLKQYLRELPESVLTRSLHKSFLRVTDLIEREECIRELGTLVARLPLANYVLLRFLTAHLILIVDNSELNRMTLSNVGIVFCPTLGLPAPLFNLFITEFRRVFCEGLTPGEEREEPVYSDEPATNYLGSPQSGAPSTTLSPRMRTNRNSVVFESESGAGHLLGMIGRTLQKEVDSDEGDDAQEEIEDQ